VYYEWWNYTHTYKYIGSFLAQFTTYQVATGLPDTASTTIYVDSVGPVSFQASPEIGSPPLRVSFIYETFWGAGDSAKWIFGDGNTSAQTSPNGTSKAGILTYQWWNYTHTYHYVGTFLAQVNVSGTRFYASASSDITVANSVEGILFRASPNFGDPPLHVSFSYETKYGSGYSATWTFGDGNVSTQASPNGSAGGGTATYQWWNYTHTYEYIGAFIPQIEVSNPTFHATAMTKIYASFVPSLFYSYYNEASLIGNGITGSTYAIGLVEECSVASSSLSVFGSDLATFDTKFNLPSASLSLGGPGASSCPNPYGPWSPETDLDIEWAHVAAPGAKIYVCFDNQGLGTANGLESCVQTFYQNRGPGPSSWNTMIVSNSWAFCAYGGESGCTNAVDPFGTSIWSPAESAGMNLFSGAGDYMPGYCVKANYPASNPYGIAVGGTTIVSVGPSGSYGSEEVWANGLQNPNWCTGPQGKAQIGIRGETDGTSPYYSAPSWQTPILGTSNRYFPDVSMIGDPNTGVPVFSQGSWIVEGGTSVGSPVWAGILDVLFQADAPGLSGFAAPWLYSVALTNPACFHAIGNGAGARDGLGTPDVGCLSTA
jgi:subtilase family serine protease